MTVSIQSSNNHYKWLADQIYALVKDEKLANEAMQVAEKNINLKKRNSIND